MWNGIQNKLTKVITSSSKNIINKTNKVTKEVLNKHILDGKRIKNDISQYTSKQALEVFDKSKTMVSSTTKQASDTASKVVKDTTNQLSKTTKDVINKSKQTTSTYISNASQTTSTYISNTSQKLLQITKSAITRSIQAIPIMISNTISKTIKIIFDPINGRILKLKHNIINSYQQIKPMGINAIRSLWWWSLAAIGVYGIATTVPKELIRVYLTPTPSSSSSSSSVPSNNANSNKNDSNMNNHHNDINNNEDIATSAFDKVTRWLQHDDDKEK